MPGNSFEVVPKSSSLVLLLQVASDSLVGLLKGSHLLACFLPVEESFLVVESFQEVGNCLDELLQLHWPYRPC